MINQLATETDNIFGKRGSKEMVKPMLNHLSVLLERAKKYLLRPGLEILYALII
jgi:hypothetical protein